MLGVLYSIYLCSYAYLLEIVPKNSQNFMNYLFILSENIIPVMIGSSYFYLGGKEWSSPFSISLIFPLIGFLMLFFIPKSPQFLLDSGSEKQAKTEIMKIATCNRKRLPVNFKIIKCGQNQVNLESNANEKYKLFTKWSYIAKLLCIVILFIHSNSQQVMMGFYAKHIKINIFLLNMIDTLTSTIMILVTYNLLKRFQLTKIMIGLVVFSLI